MGYGSYILPDGREAGYMVDAVCDKGGCEAEINRGLGYLCGNAPDGHRDEDAPGCGQYFCMDHLSTDAHNCPNPNGHVDCDHCQGSNTCCDCNGEGCDECDDTGECPDCDENGQIDA